MIQKHTNHDAEGSLTVHGFNNDKSHSARQLVHEAEGAVNKGTAGVVVAHQHSLQAGRSDLGGKTVRGRRRGGRMEEESILQKKSETITPLLCYHRSI